MISCAPVAGTVDTPVETEGKIFVQRALIHVCTTKKLLQDPLCPCRRDRGHSCRDKEKIYVQRASIHVFDCQENPAGSPVAGTVDTPVETEGKIFVLRALIHVLTAKKILQDPFSNICPPSAPK